jgi:acetolactate synthase-1/2/3 large subunit
MTATAGSELVDVFLEKGVRRCYCVPGESYLEVLRALEGGSKGTLVSTRHESGAAFMAEAEGKLTGRPALAAATRAPGAANLAIGVHTALHDSTPLIALLGQVETGLMGKDAAFQGADLEAFYRPITKWVLTLRGPSDAREVATAAYQAATTGRPGPVAIVLPSDVLSRDVTGDRTGTCGAFATTDGPQALPAPAAHGLVERLASSERPVMIVGGRCAGCADDLTALAERLGTGVYTAFRRQDCFPNDHPAYLGHLSLSTPGTLLEPVLLADVVLVLGCRLSEVTTQHFKVPPPSAFVVRIDSWEDAQSPGRRPDMEVVARVPQAVKALLSAAKARTHARGLSHYQAAHEKYLDYSALPAPGSGAPLDPAEVVAGMAACLPEDTIIANDAGNFSIFLHRYWRYRRPFTQLAPTSGAMGYGVPAAIAAGICQPDRLAVAVVGDGGYLMTGQEVETAVRYGVHVLVIVFRNGMYGTIAMHQAKKFGELAGVQWGEVDLAAHARSLGARGFSVTDGDELREALSEGLSARGPVVLDVAVDPDLVVPGQRLSEMLRASPLM